MPKTPPASSPSSASATGCPGGGIERDDTLMSAVAGGVQPVNAGHGVHISNAPLHHCTQAPEPGCQSGVSGLRLLQGSAEGGAGSRHGDRVGGGGNLRLLQGSAEPGSGALDLHDAFPRKRMALGVTRTCRRRLRSQCQEQQGHGSQGDQLPHGVSYAARRSASSM